MSSVEYEKLVKELLGAELQREQAALGFQLFHDKKYKGKSGHHHQIDVSAELKIAGINLLILVECKYYSHKVGIDEVMELATRIDDIGAHKGIVVTTVGFQEGAVKLARSKGIALVEACNFEWRPLLESPGAEGYRREMFAANAREFLSWFLGPEVEPEVVDRAVQELADRDIVSKYGVESSAFRSTLGSGRSVVSTAAPKHGFIVQGESNSLVVDNGGLFELFILQAHGDAARRPRSRTGRILAFFGRRA